MPLEATTEGVLTTTTTTSGSTATLTGRNDSGRVVVTNPTEGGQTVGAATPGVAFPFVGSVGGSPFIPGFGTGSHVNTNTPAIDGSGRGANTLYGTDSPFAILADLAIRQFGTNEGDNTPTTTYVPVVGGSSGGSNAAAVFILLAVVGAGYYFFIYRRRSNG